MNGIVGVASGGLSSVIYRRQFFSSFKRQLTLLSNYQDGHQPEKNMEK